MISTDADWVNERTILHAVYSSVIGLLLVIITVIAIMLCRRPNDKGTILRIFATASLQRKPSKNKQMLTDYILKQLLDP